jgi:hypothetical protein
LVSKINKVDKVDGVDGVDADKIELIKFEFFTDPVNPALDSIDYIISGNPAVCSKYSRHYIFKDGCKAQRRCSSGRCPSVRLRT